MTKIEKKVWENSLHTCQYLDGYKNASSLLRVKCIKHDHTFETRYENIRRDNRAHYICPFCQEEAKNARNAEHRTEVQCAYCGIIFSKPNSKIDNSKSGLYFCCREHKDLAQRLDSGAQFNDLRPEHYGSTSKNYREMAFRHYEHQCSVCGWHEDADILEVHHINENHYNNELNNLIILCPICHRKLTSHKYTLINREQIVPC